MVLFVEKITSGKKDFVKKTPIELYKIIKTKKTQICEIISTEEHKYVKPYIDFDDESSKTSIVAKKKYGDGFKELISDITNGCKKIFGNDTIVNFTKNNRSIKKEQLTYKVYKVSYHFIVENKKIELKKLGKIIKDNINHFKFFTHIDTGVYSNGIQKFRLPFTIKDDKSKKIMLTNLFDNEENFKKFVITETDELQEFIPKLTIVETLQENKDDEIKEEENIEEYPSIMDKNDYNYIKTLLNKYDNNKIEYNKKYYQIVIKTNNKCFSGLTHKTNRRIIYFDILKNQLIMKCFSNKCKNKEEILLKNVLRKFRNFNLSIFNNLNDNYGLMKKYFDTRIIFLSDINTYKQLLYVGDEVSINDISSIPIMNSTSSIIKKDGKTITCNFATLYKNDKFKKIYKQTSFSPREDNDIEFYNEFDGLGYTKCLKFGDDKDLVYKQQQDNINFLLGFLKEILCDDNDKILSFLLDWLSCIVKYPWLLNHIILVLYSREQGSGKSRFSSGFIGKIIGSNYTSEVSIKQVINDYSNVFYKKILNIIEELEYNTNSEYDKVLKNNCQANKMILNEKNQPMRPVENFVKYIITTNDYRSLPLNQYDRRHFCLEVKKLYNREKEIKGWRREKKIKLIC